jgi:hypothetical protein
MNVKNIILIFFLLLGQHWLNAQNFCADYKFICKGGIDEKGIGLRTNDSTFCYKWNDPDKLLNDANSPNPKIKKALDRKQEFTVKVTTPDGDLFEDKITVLVYSLDLEISLPKIDGGTAVAEADEQMVGSQTFINIDNDDADATPDLNDNLVQGGDNELMKLKGTIKFYPDIEFALKSSDGSASKILPDKNIALWKFNTKEISIAKNNTSYAFSKADLIFDPLTNEFLFERWIEGIDGNDITRGTELELALDDSANSALAPSAACAKDIVACTIVEITSVKWLGMGNGALKTDNPVDTSGNFTGDFLDADTQYGATNSVRVFPDGRISGGVVGTSKNKVRIEVKTKCTMAIDAKIYLRAFDMDDPSQNKSDIGIVNRPDGGLLILDPNDDGIAGTYSGGGRQTYDIHNDNRALVKYGSVPGIDANGIFSADILASNKDITINDFQVSEFAGDNYQLFAANDRAHLLYLENKDDPDVGAIKDVSSGGRNLPISTGVKSNVLTVWRLLHLEYDSMKNFKWDFDRDGNYQEGFNLLSLTNAKSDNCKNGKASFGQIFNDYDIDNQVWYSNPNTSLSKKGKCENGLTFAFFENIKIDSLDGHDKDNVSFKRSVNLIPVPTSLNKIKNGVYTKVKLNKIDQISQDTFIWYTNPPLSIIDTGSTLGYSDDSKIFQANGKFGTNKIAFSNFYVRDDDDNSLLPKNSGNLDVLEIILKKCFIQLVEDAGGLGVNDTTITFTPNINAGFIEIPGQGRNELLGIVSKINTKNQKLKLKKENFWTINLLSAFQGDFYSDNDPIDENTSAILGKSLPFSVDSTIISNRLIADGCYSSQIYLETIRDTKTSIKLTIAHEVGHQFGLSHGSKSSKAGNEIPEYKINMEIMNENVSRGFFIPRHRNLIRSRKKSPGQN